MGEVSKKHKEQYKFALARDVRNIQAGNGFSRSQADAHADSYKFLGQLSLQGKNFALDGSMVLLSFQNKNYFVTVRHCLSGEEPSELCSIHIYVQGKRYRLKPSDFRFHPYYDLAIMEAPNGLKTDLILDHVGQKVNIGDSVETYGFPCRSFLYSVGKVVSPCDSIIEHTALTYDGSSGGPIVVQSKNDKILVGITYAYNIPCDKDIEKFLDQRSNRATSLAVSYKTVANFIFY